VYNIVVGQFHFDPDSYRELMAEEVPDYARLQDEAAAASADLSPVRRVLDLGTGTGETARRVLARHPTAELVGIDSSPAMLARAKLSLSGADLRVARLEDPLPEGPFDLIVSALAVHHLAGPAKADLFARLAEALRPGGRLVLADVVVPDDPADVVTPVDGIYDVPSRVDEQVAWLRAAGLEPRVAWAHRDLAVLVADR
jgi:tRNA (cmo5U34)-methyltransferase